MGHNLSEKNSFDVQDALENVEAAVAATGVAVVTKSVQVAGSDGTLARTLTTDASGHLQVDALSSALPSGAATEATLASIKTATELLDDTVATTGSNVPAKGLLMAGTDSTGKARAPLIESDGHVQVDVLSGGGTVGGALEATQGDVKTAVQIMDDWDESDRAKVNPIVGQAGIAAGSGANGVTVPRVTIATDDTMMTSIRDITIERYLEIDRCTATTGWSATTVASTNIATTTDHVPHEDKATSLNFDKAADAAIVEAGIQKTLSSVDASAFEGPTLVKWNMKCSSITNVNYAFIRLGTSSSHYTEWRVSGDDMVAATWNQLTQDLSQFASQTGNGALMSDLDYVAAGVVFDAAANTLVDIGLDYIELLSAPHVNASLNIDIGSVVVPASVRVQKVGPASNANWPTGAGAVDTGTPRMTMASDSPDVTALQIMDDWDSSDHCKTYPHPEFTDSTTILNAVTADNGAPAGVVGIALQSDTKDAYIEVWAVDEEAGVSNVDINVYVYQPDSATWRIPSGGALVDLQLETNNRWGVVIPNARLIGTRVYVEVDNYVAGATTIKVSAKMTEVTY